jgi:hypothetical protein
MLVTKDSSTYRNARRVSIYPYRACFIIILASKILIELRSRVKVSIINFSRSSTLLRISFIILSKYPIYFDASRSSFIAASSFLTSRGSHSKVAII